MVRAGVVTGWSSQVRELVDRVGIVNVRNGELL